jgi:predicted nicotinamide N-methyase
LTTSTDFKYKEVVVSINGIELNLLEVINFDELFNKLVEQELTTKISLDDFIPYWTELWPSAVGLCHYLLDNVDVIFNKRVLEIGCGLGLPSLVAVKIGAQNVLATDLISDALSHVLLNSKLNQLSQNLDTKILDWRKSTIEVIMPFDIILAADIVYEERFVNDFINLIAAINDLGLKKSIIIAEPSRQVASFMIEKLRDIKNLHIDTKQFDIDSKGSHFKINVHHIQFGSVNTSMC